MLSSLRAKNIDCEEEAKFIQDRILSTERNLAEFCHVFAQYSRKAARVRDKGDELAQTVTSIAESETISKSLSGGLASFSGALTTISDYGDFRVQHIDNKVVHELSQYESICKQSKEEVKGIFSARDKELTRKKQLDRIRERNPRNRQQIINAETELVKATAEVSRTVHNLEEKITAFERQKLYNVKTIFLDFIATELGYHAKALELLTKAYQDIVAIDEDADLQEFKKTLHLSDIAPSSKKASRSLGSINTIFSASKRQPQQGIPVTKQNPRMAKSRSADTLNSIDDESDAVESNSEQDSDDKSSATEQSQEMLSPFIAQKYLK